MSPAVDELVRYYRKVHTERFSDMPIVNEALEVEAVGFRKLDEHDFGVLITPWFMNLFLLPASDRWDERPQGSVCKVALPDGEVDFSVAHDNELGTTLSAALFSTVVDFPDMDTAREVARETLRLLFDRSQRANPRDEARVVSRRGLLRRLGGIEGE